jgi:hypothetical protein
VERATGSEGEIAVMGVGDRQAEGAAIAGKSFDLVAEEADAEDDFANAAGADEMELMGEEGLAGYFDEGFGSAVGEWAEAVGDASREQSEPRRPKRFFMALAELSGARLVRGVSLGSGS